MAWYVVVNAGSTSLKAAVLKPESGQTRAELTVQALGDDDGVAELTLETENIEEERTQIDADTAADAMAQSLERLAGRLEKDVEIRGVGHRVVHGGEAFTRPVRIDDEVEAGIESVSELAPLHNPANLAGIRAARSIWSDVSHVAVFDTAFHSTLPSRAREYAIDHEVSQAHGLRRYGFHGISHEYVAHRAAEYLGEDVQDLRLITLHLGGGCSAAAVEWGRSIDTTMGMTPLEGLVMGTRSGDVDPGLLLYLLDQEEWDRDRLEKMLNEESGLKGLSGRGPDLRAIEQAAAQGDERCRQAIQVFAHRVRRYIGAFAAVMDGVDAIVVTAGIGENSALMRQRIGERLTHLGVRFDDDANRSLDWETNQQSVAELSQPHSRCDFLAVQTDEAHAIAKKTESLVRGEDKPADTTHSIPIAVSARHVHLTDEMVEKLFGEGHELTERAPLSQPGQFASEETVTLVGPKRQLEGVRVLGPTRDHNQVEISRTDEFSLGVDAPVRMSGDLEGTPGITLRGPEGEVRLEQGLICALRHIHMTPEDADQFGVEHEDYVDVAVQGGARDLVFQDVVIRVKPTYKLEMHIDTDEANAANLPQRSEGSLVSVDAEARLSRRQTRAAE
jgi:acetate kinase